MTFLCRRADLAATGAKGVTLDDGREIVVVETPAGARAYVNSCPHGGTPLETFPDRFLSADRAELICTTHGARFLVGSGLCVLGPCKDRFLAPLALDEQGDELHLSENPPAR